VSVRLAVRVLAHLTAAALGVWLGVHAILDVYARVDEIGWGRAWPALLGAAWVGYAVGRARPVQWARGVVWRAITRTRNRPRRLLALLFVHLALHPISVGRLFVLALWRHRPRPTPIPTSELIHPPEASP
jgi:hypothetical protein